MMTLNDTSADGTIELCLTGTTFEYATLSLTFCMNKWRHTTADSVASITFSLDMDSSVIALLRDDYEHDVYAPDVEVHPGQDEADVMVTHEDGRTFVVMALPSFSVSASSEESTDVWIDEPILRACSHQKHMARRLAMEARAICDVVARSITK